MRLEPYLTASILVASLGLLFIDNKIINFRTDSHTRGDFKVFKPHCKVNARAFSFAARHVNCWNALPNSVRCATSLSSFKRLLCTSTCDRHRFYVLNVIFKCDLYIRATVSAC